MPLPDGIIDALGRVYLNAPLVAGSLPLLTQDAWFIDSVNGNDVNSGANPSQALKTSAEFSRRWAGRVYASIPAISVQFSGTFDIQDFIIPPMVFLGPTVISVTGQAPAILGGPNLITGYQAYNPGAGTQCTLTDALQNFSAWKTKRIRITIGAAAVVNACASFGSIRGSNTVINLSQFRGVPAAANLYQTTKQDAAIGNTYVVEDLITTFCRWDIKAQGSFQLVIKDCRFKANNTTTPILGGHRQCVVDIGNRGSVLFYGCEFNSSATVMSMIGPWAHAACTFVGSGFNYFGPGYVTELSAGIYALIQSFGPITIAGTDNLHDGDGVRDVSLYPWEGSTRVETGHRVFRGNAAAGGHVDIANGAVWTGENSSSFFWSEIPASSLNTNPYALHVWNGCSFTYTAAAKPTATGAIAGNDVKLAAGALLAWAAIPAIAAAPDTAYANVRQ